MLLETMCLIGTLQPAITRHTRSFNTLEVFNRPSLTLLEELIEARAENFSNSSQNHGAHVSTKSGQKEGAFVRGRRRRDVKMEQDPRESGRIFHGFRLPLR